MKTWLDDYGAGVGLAILLLVSVGRYYDFNAVALGFGCVCAGGMIGLARGANIFRPNRRRDP